MSRKIVIVGGVAGGATAATRLRRLDEQAEIILIERGPDIAFANCGLPYHIGGEITKRDKLLVKAPPILKARFNLDIRTRSEVSAIDRAARRVRVRELESGREYDERFDALLLSPGATPVRPPIHGIEHPAVRTLRNLVDADRIQQLVKGGAKSAVVVGGGFIGLEMAEGLRRRGLDVSLVEMLPQVMPPLDPEMAVPLQRELKLNRVDLRLKETVTGFENVGGRVRVQLKGGEALETDLVILAVGVRPDTELARAAGLELNERGAIVVDEHMRTSDPHVYAVGDAVQVRDPVLGGATMIPLAGPANRQARIAADNICGRESEFRGTQGTSIVRVFDVTAGMTGASEKVLKSREVPYRKVYVHGKHHAGYYPGAQTMTIKLMFSPGDGRILGAQVFGGAGVDKRIDVFAMAIQAGMTVYDLEEAELAYAPPFGSAKDPVNIAGFVASNLLRGDVEFIYAEELDGDAAERYTLLDVRTPMEHQTGLIPGAEPFPLRELRQFVDEIPRDKPVVVYCQEGQRAYYACRMLRQKGMECRNLAGGILVHRLFEALASSA
jgi:NADPH-dependent 2,4-dienoyl-CoA reductase/sulfur reductase-like enzyme/rhodanese-related sulfurtransferase